MTTRTRPRAATHTATINVAVYTRLSADPNEERR